MNSRKFINISDARARLGRLVERAAFGEEIVISRNGKPRARLVPFTAPQQRVPGRGAGKWRIAGDFNEALPPEILAAFDGR
jgi:prevent-host-death family protein